MAALQERNGSFRVLFRHHGKQHAFTLGKVSAAEAESKLGHVENRLAPAPSEAPGLCRPGVGHRGLRPARGGDGNGPCYQIQPSATKELTLVGLARPIPGNSPRIARRADHRRDRAALQASGRRPRRAVPDPRADALDLQGYVDRQRRPRDMKGLRLSPATIRKEIVTLRTAWNWGRQNGGWSAGRFPYDGLSGPFQKWL